MSNATSKRRSIEIDGLKHTMPIPNASRIGPFVATGSIFGTDISTGKIPADLESQVRNVFANIRRIVEAAGGTTEDILKINVWMKDKSQRTLVNEEWLKMFPDEHSRPARHTHGGDDLAPGVLIQCEMMAVIE